MIFFASMNQNSGETKAVPESSQTSSTKEELGFFSGLYNTVRIFFTTKESHSDKKVVDASPHEQF